MHKGINTTVDEGQTPIVTTGGAFSEAVAVDLQNVAIGGDIAGTLDTTRPSRGGGQAVATPIDLRQASRGEKVTNNRSSGSGGPPGSGVGDAGDPAFTVSERGQAVAFKPSHYTRGKDGKPDEVAPPLSADADKGDQDTVIMRQSIGFNWQNGGGYGNANDGLAITEEGTGPLSRSQVPACVTGARTHALTTRAAAVEEDGTGRGTPIVPAVFTKAKRAQSVNDDESWVPGEVAPTQNQFDVGDTRATTVVAFTTEQTPKFKEECALTMTKQSTSGGGQPQCVAFTQNSRDEVRQIDGDGQIAGALSAEAGMHQTNYLAFANRTRDGVKVPEVMKDGVVPALTNPGGGGRADAVNVCLPTPIQEVSKRTGKSTDDPRAGIGIGTAGDPMYTLQAGAQHGCHAAMQVRRLTPTECCRLQGFPDDHCDITFRKKPAADGPKYRALGNSMAVPCMAWLGYRIHLATRQDSK